MEKKIMVDLGYVEEMFAELPMEEPCISDRCAQELNDLTEYFMKKYCNGSEQMVYELAAAYMYRALGAKSVRDITKDDLADLFYDAQSGSDEDYENYIGTVISLYYIMDEDMLIPNCPYFLDREVREIIIEELQALTCRLAIPMYMKIKSVLSSFLSVKDIDETIELLDDLYDLERLNGETGWEYIERLFDKEEDLRALVVLANHCRCNSNKDDEEILDSIKL